MELPRPEERAAVDLDMRVWGMGADGRAFSQCARARNISAGGALLCGIEHELKIGDTIGVKAGEKKRDARWSGRGKPGRCRTFKSECNS